VNFKKPFAYSVSNTEKAKNFRKKISILFAGELFTMASNIVNRNNLFTFTAFIDYDGPRGALLGFIR
jgi:hypothetical protein